MTARDEFVALDGADPLGAWPDRFHRPAGEIYLDGNSLGAQPRGVAARLEREVAVWRDRGIRGWNEADWVGLADRAAGRIARLIGARPGEVAVTDSTTVNLFQAVSAAVRLQGRVRASERGAVILTEDGNFPTDRYVLDAIADAHGWTVRAVPRDRLADRLDDDVAVLAATHVDYRSGHRLDGAALTAAAHAVGGLAVWDLAHSAGAVTVDLGAWQADLAVGCTYKFLNGGPGAPAYVYAAERWHDRLRPPVQGWFGHARPFDFADRWEPAPGAGRFRNGTPPVLSLAALDEALAVWADAPLAAVDAKAGRLTAAFIDLVEERVDGVEVVTPRVPGQRGAQVSLRHPHAYPVMQALIDRGVVGDHRPPDLLRFGFPPLTVRYADVWDAVEVLRDVLATGAWDRPAYHRRNPVI